MTRFSRPFLALLLTAICGAVVSAQEHHRVPELDADFLPPSADWMRQEAVPATSGGMHYEFRTADGARTVDLMVWSLGKIPGLSEMCASELRQMGDRGDVEEIATRAREIFGTKGRGVRYRFVPAGGGAAVTVDTTYFPAGKVLGRLAVSVPTADEGELDALVPVAAHGLREGAGLPLVVEIPEPDAAHVVTIVHSSDPAELPYLYLEALPGAAHLDGGVPIVLAVGPSVEATARAFLRKYRPGTLRLVGSPHPELPTVREADDAWSPGGTVVVSARRLDAAVPAACLAVRLGVPLLVADDALASRLHALAPTRALVCGDVVLPDSSLPVEHVTGPADVARLAGGASYVALCNVTPRSDTSPAPLAAALAAARGGVVLGLDIDVTRHRHRLRPTDECPPGMEDVEGTGNYLTTTVRTSSGPVLAGAARTGVVRVASNDSPRYGRLRVDLDGDGLLEAHETPRIGERIQLGDDAFHLTYHYGHAFVPYLENELVLDPYHPDDARDPLRALASELGTLEHLAVVGTPQHVPFCYREATGYFEVYDIKQEIATDAPYANLDEDAYLELAVGRMPVEDLVAGSVVIATTLAYPRLGGDWHTRAAVIQPGFHELEGSLPWVLPNAEALIRGVEGDLIAAGVETRGFYRSDVEIDAVLSAMSDAGWIAYFNHSGPGTWGIHPGASIVTGAGRGASDRSLPSLAGAPIVFGGGCSSAALDVGHPLQATFPGRFFSLGAVAYLGNTRVAYARSEHLAQLFFARLASGEATLGQAYRDGRNFLAHLLEAGHLVGRLDVGVDIGVVDFLWGQHGILNLFGDPALRPRLPDGAAPPLDIAFAPTDEPGRHRLTIVLRGEDRRDPILMMPASGQGTPREFFARTGAGMTSSHLPGNFVQRDLAPVRSVPSVVPGAWVDVPLPPTAAAVGVELAEGPAWCDRGFAVRTGADGAPRLQMYVPLVRSTLEHGEGTVASRVAFDVTWREHAGDAPVEATAPRIPPVERWKPVRTGAPDVAAAARPVLDAVRARHSVPAPTHAPWTIANPQPRLYGARAHFTGTWDDAGNATVTARDLPPHLEARRTLLEEAVRDVASLPFGDPLPPLEGFSLERAGEGVLVATPRGEAEGDEHVEIHVAADGTVERVVEHRFGLRLEMRYEWRMTDRGPILSRRTALDPVRPERSIVHDVVYEDDGTVPRPLRVVLRMPGHLPRDVPFEFTFRDV